MTDRPVGASLPGAAPLKQQIAEWRESARAVREQAASAEEQHYFGAGNALASKASQLEACADDLETLVGAALEAGPSPAVDVEKLNRAVDAMMEQAQNLRAVMGVRGESLKEDK